MPLAGQSRGRLILASALLALQCAAFTQPRLAWAAAPLLQVAADVVYRPLPAEGKIQVTVEAIATSQRIDAPGERSSYDDVSLLLPGGAVDIVASHGLRRLGVTTLDSGLGYEEVQIDFGTQIYSQQSFAFRLAFDVVDRLEDDIRIGSRILFFPIWAVGTEETPGGSVTVVLPPRFELAVDGAPAPQPQLQPDGGTAYRWDVADVVEFGSYVTADWPNPDPASFTITTVVLDGESGRHEIIVRAWDDDDAWSDRITELVRIGMPKLGDAIGLDYQDPKLTVEETASRAIAGYAGEFLVAPSKINVDYEASDVVVLHELAHAWFNPEVFVDRWISEGFASYYAEVVAAELELPPDRIDLTDDLLPSAFPLVEWNAFGIDTTIDATAEYYAYAGSLVAAEEIARLAGTDGLRRVWDEMVHARSPYQAANPGAPNESGLQVLGDWRALLDHLETQTDADYDPIWREWILPAADYDLLDDRAAARERYAAAVELAADWDLPRAIRRAMGDWRFNDADELIIDATALLDRREALESFATHLSVELAEDMHNAFEAGELATAAIVADETDAALRAMADAQAAGGWEPLVLIGMIGNPAASLDDARVQLAAGDEATARETATDAAVARRGAGEAGIWRSAGVVGTLLLLGSGGAVVARRRRSRKAVSASRG
jgi:hypothetical protein